MNYFAEILLEFFRLKGKEIGDLFQSFWAHLIWGRWIKVMALAILIVIGLGTAYTILAGGLGWIVATLWPAFAHKLADGPAGVIATGMNLYLATGSIILFASILGAGVICLLYLSVGEPFVQWIRQNWHQATHNVRERRCDIE